MVKVKHITRSVIGAIVTWSTHQRTFSRARLLLPHTRSRLSAQSTRSLLCLGSWAPLGLIKDTDIKASSALPELDGDSDIKMPSGWDGITSIAVV
jgi:hypothetical protein